jgi:hypothetical protein
MRRSLILVLALVAAASCGKQTPANCPGYATCELCTMADGCEWCGETNQCLASGGTCGGTIATTPDQCSIGGDTPDAGAP